MPFLPWLIFITVAGACVGSFLNVVTMRLPEGKNIVTPPSACPKCGHKLAWFENIPILSWLALGGKCRSCKAPISVQYPVVEAITAILFGGLTAVYYLTDVRVAMNEAGFFATWPVLVVQLVLISALLAATIIDAKLFIIPLSLPWVATVVAIIALPGATWLGWLSPTEIQYFARGDVVPVVGARGCGAALGGVFGLAIALGLLQTRMLPRSFQETEAEITDPAPPDEFLNHPHPRREVIKELPFVALPLIGAVIGWFVTPAGTLYVSGADQVGSAVAVLGGCVAGYLVGGGLVWGTRIFGTLGFGKEAMGLGDVHLLGAIGAVLGPIDAVLVFFVAPFFGLAAALVLAGISAILKGEVRVIPYGPYLAGAAVVVMIFREPMLVFLGLRLPFEAMVESGVGAMMVALMLMGSGFGIV